MATRIIRRRLDEGADITAYAEDIRSQIDLVCTLVETCEKEYRLLFGGEDYKLVYETQRHGAREAVGPYVKVMVAAGLPTASGERLETLLAPGEPPWGQESRAEANGGAEDTITQAARVGVGLLEIVGLEKVLHRLGQVELVKSQMGILRTINEDLASLLRGAIPTPTQVEHLLERMSTEIDGMRSLLVDGGGVAGIGVLERVAEQQRRVEGWLRRLRESKYRAGLEGVSAADIDQQKMKCNALMRLYRELAIRCRLEEVRVRYVSEWEM